MDALAAIGAARLLPVVRVPGAGEAVDHASRLVELGAGVVELTATIDGWVDALRTVRASAPDVALGVGTVATGEQAEQAVTAGADFLVSAWPAPDVRSVAAAHAVPLLEGGFTPAELAAASGRGVAKLFPAHVGGPGYLRSVLAVLPGARIVPTGGIGVADAPAYLEAGAFAVGLGTAGLAGGELRELVERMRAPG